MIRSCVECGEPFEARNSRYLVCGSECSRALRNRRKRAWISAHRESEARRSRDWAARNPEKAKASQARYRLLNREKLLLTAAHHRARKRNLPFNLTLDDVRIPEVCPVLGVKLTTGAPGRLNTSPTLDRIENDKGYVTGNVVVVSWRANTLKNDATIEELSAVLRYMRKHQRRGP